MKRPLVLLLLGAALATVSAGAKAPADRSTAIGRWLTESGNLEIEILPCGKALCGTVVRVLANRSMSNPQAQMKSADGKSPLGKQILSNFVAADEGTWEGQIYNRENGNTYDCIMKPLPPDKLEIRGYKFLPLFGKTQVWTRVAP